jgi:tetratricopeptide (TPR) repeat protein
VDVEALLRTAHAELDAGDLEEAIRAASSCIDAAPRNPRPYFVRSAALTLKGDLAGALRDCDDILALDPRSVAALTNRGDLRLRTRDLEGARADFRALLELDPASVRGHLGMAAWAEAKGDPLLAESEYTRAVKSTGPDPIAFEHRGWFHLRRGKHRLAITDFAMAMARDPANARYVAARAEARRRMRDYEGAVADFGRAIVLDPRDARIVHDRGISLYALQDFKGALADFDRVLLVEPDFGPSLHMRAKVRALMDPPDLVGAAEDIARDLELRPDDIEGYWVRAVVRRRGGDREGALASVEEAVTRYPRSARARANRAEALYELRRWKDALADYRAACALDPGERDYAMLRIWILRSRMGEEEAATKEMEGYLGDRPRGGEDDGWYRKLAGHLAGSVPEEVLFADWAVEGPRRALEKQCEAYFYAGMRRIVRGERSVGEAYLRKCRETDRRDFLEFDSAAVELEVPAQGK